MQEHNVPSLMGIFAHPDDESFGMAGTLARATMGGHRAAIVCATRGEEGKIADPSLATLEKLGQVREQELRNACAAVGVTDVSFLDYVDGHLAEADVDEAVGRVVYHIRRFRPDVVVTFAANGGYGHVDHMAIHRMTLSAIEAATNPARYAEYELEPHRVRKVYFQAMPRERVLQMRDEARKRGEDFIPGGDEATIPVEEMGMPMSDITTFVKLTGDEFEAKIRSMMSHATQMPADSPWARATPDELRAFMGTEVFQFAPPPLSESEYAMPEQDVFAGL